MLAALALAVGGLAVGLVGCGAEPAPVTTSGLSELLTEAEQGADETQDPAAFISLCTNCHD
ncbi:MAG TPA: hypothetical protein VFD74_07160, partial [Thermoleophilia bacterium]|nr:hypothetical protein [Thermoleophilia bacterium]